MLFELSTSIIAGGLAGFSYFQKQGGVSGNDAAKIQRICSNNGLTVKEDGKKRNMHLLRKSKIKDGQKVVGTEYAFRIPLGLSFKDFQDKIDHIQDGLNNVKEKIFDFSISDIKSIPLDRHVINSIKKILNKKKTVHKEVELSYDGVLKVRVYDEPLTTDYPFDEAMKKGIDGWKVVVGKDRRGNRILFDFEKKYNIIVSGTPGYGKSNWINSTINTLLLNHPNDVTFTLIDLKDGLEFNRYRNLKQVTSFAMTPETARESLKKAVEKMQKINEYLRENGYSNVKEAGFKERHFIIIDEGADLADDKICQEYLADIARKGRASGLKLIFATQYPTVEVVKSQIKRQCLGRLSFVLDTSTASNVALDQGGAELLPAIEGRALYKDLRLIEVQTPYIDNETIKKNIQPHITFKARKDDVPNASDSVKRTAIRKHSLELEEIGLS